MTGTPVPIDADLARKIVRPKLADAHKGTVGTLALVAGCPEYRGAAVLAAKGAYRAGAGLVRVVAEEPVCAAVAASVPEAVFCPQQELVSALASCTAAVAGPGMPIGGPVRDLMLSVIRGTDRPLVIDGGGLSSAASDLDAIDGRTGPTVLTPHPGEFARLTGRPVPEILSSRFEAAADFSLAHPAVLVLKSDRTAVACAGRVFVNTAGNAGLAKAGSGDLLAGIIGALLARGTDPLDAALLGVWLHARAADLAACSINTYSLCASDVAQAVSDVYNELLQEQDR